jgi:hypothetical protein
MPVSDKNKQIPVVIPKEWLTVLEQYMDEEVLRSVSSAAARLIVQGLKEWTKNREADK